MIARCALRCMLVASASIALLASAMPASGADDTLAQLFAEFGARRERQARFVERKFSALLKKPVESSGTLSFRAPDVLHKVTLQPRRESVRIEGNKVTYEGDVGAGAAPRTFALSDAPQLAALIESLRATLAGDLPALRQHYEVSWLPAQSGQDWQITLIPRERTLRDAVAKIVLRGAGAEVRAVEIVEASGDLTLLAITSPPPKSKPEK